MRDKFGATIGGQPFFDESPEGFGDFDRILRSDEPEREFGARLREVNIDSDPELHERYNLDVPVIFLRGRKIAKHRVDPVQFKRLLLEARRDFRERA